MPVKISVVIPTYRRPALLRQCLAALAAQHFDPAGYEVVVVSDGYDAATEAVVREAPGGHPAVRYHHLSCKRGPAAARNLGWQRAAGPLVAFTDDDCLPDPGWLRGFWEAYRGETEAAFSGRVRVPVPTPPTDYEKSVTGLQTADFVTANCLCTRAALQRIGGFDERFSMAWREDSDLEFKLIRAGIPIGYKADAEVVHPVRAAPWGVSIREQKKSLFNALLYRKHPELYRQKVQPGPRWDYYRTVLCLLLGVAGLVVGVPVLAWAALAGWLLLTARFAAARLAGTSRQAGHVLEMIVTSAVIPVACVCWRLYGAWKYKVFFL
ncbi:MAG: Glycosyl transferase, family 2 [uncultured Cytophagales bacterium]|uniref:Glycosyl transferase, family 2 n=1 Tax=uncultured Cytophagales bacterium TaxID=158755 RepID=A0A6J4JXV7_9SPHI|nr:MAG: Glycosyl transferase, family 2 [uncultured Cytophagales bacterium]